MNFQDEEEEEVDDHDALLFVPRNMPVPEPRPQDVICGRGKSVAQPGNQRLAALVRERKEEYQRASRRDDKTRITFEIVQAMRQGPSPARYECPTKIPSKPLLPSSVERPRLDWRVCPH